MDYYIEHSSSTMPAYVRALAGQGFEEAYADRFFFESNAYDAIPYLQRWARANAGTTVETRIDAPSVMQGISLSTSTQNFAKIDFVNARLEYIYCNDAAAAIDPSQSKIALAGVVDAVEDLIDANDFVTLDELLIKVEPSRLRSITNVAFLRTAFQAKDKLKNWNLLYQGVYVHLANSGQDPNRALRGLSAPRTSSFA